MDPLGIYKNSKIIDIKKIDATHFYMTLILKGNENMDKIFDKAQKAFFDKKETELIYKMEITPGKRYFLRSIMDSTGRMRREGWVVSQETHDEINAWLKDNGKESL